MDFNIRRKVFLGSAALALALFISGCSDPRNQPVSKLTTEQKAELGKKLTSEEGQKLTAWMMRTAMTKGDIPTDITVNQAIKDQDAWVEKKKAEDEVAELLRKKIAAERKIKQEEFTKLFSTVILNKRNSSGEYGQRFVYFDVAYENKGTKDVAGVKGVLKITDMFGDKVMNIKWTFDDGVAATKTFVEKGSGIKINQFMDEHMKLWNADMEKLRFEFEIEKIMFKDGSALDAPT